MAAKRILLIEDEPDVADLLALGLRSAGYIVDVVETAALARVRLDGMRYALVIDHPHQRECPTHRGSCARSQHGIDNMPNWQATRPFRLLVSARQRTSNEMPPIW